MTAGTVLVLGGSGFVGRAVLTALAESGRYAPICFARRPDRQAWPTRQGDATDRASLAQALRGVDYVVDAVRVRPRAMRRAARTIGTESARAGVGLIVHVSSMAVYGDVTGLVREDAPMPPEDRSYAGSKRACETILRRTAGEARLVILRPGLVYGPGGEQWTLRLCRLLRARRLGDLGPAGDGFCNLIHARDVGAAAVAALAAPQAAGQVINLATRTPPRWNDVLIALARAIGAVPVARIPGWRLAFEATVLAAPLYAARALKLPAHPPDPMSPALLRLMRQDIRLDPGRADALGFARTEDWAGLAQAATA